MVVSLAAAAEESVGVDMPTVLALMRVLCKLKVIVWKRCDSRPGLSDSKDARVENAELHTFNARHCVLSGRAPKSALF